MIELLSHDGSDNSIANTARVSFAGDDWLELPADYTTEQRNKLIKYLATHRHMTPFRHNSLSIRCTAPIFIARQLGKHQAGLSWNEVSRRYVKGNIEFHTPEAWRAAPEGSIKQGSAGVHKDNQFVKESYATVMSSVLEFYDTLLEGGVAPEQARMVLPQSMMTTWVWTGNLLSMAHIYNERIAAGAQLEAQDFAKALDAVIKPMFPVAWEALTGHNK